ncbi:MAG TPA: hypothetical protein EYQ27_15085 [Gemmatimonadetes bacterium]|nr:hypothetical protein [Gemmatimonadota bacterium]
MTDRRRSRWLALGISVFLSTVLVIAAFNPAPHNGGDNAAYVTLAYSLVQHGTYTDLYDPAELPHTKYPPVFPGLLAALLLLGARTWTALKAVTAISTVATVGFTFLWAERRLGAWPALGVAALLAISSAVVYHSHWILSDPLFVAFTMAALWALEGADEDEAGWWWTVGGVAAVGLAYFTRSAGLPLLVALFVWFGLRKRWRSLGLSSVAVGVPALLWWLRGRGEGVGDYGAEFWMVDPYQPGLGTVGIAGLVGRAVDNAWAYTTGHGPGGILGGSGGGVAAFGMLLTVAALYGWFRSSRERIGVGEIFLPLYAGLILLWPEVWSGDRFALPLYPLFFLFAALTLRDVVSKIGEWVGSLGRSALVVAAISAVLLPSGRTWLNSVQQASSCADATRPGGAWACYGSGVVDFAAAAEWMHESLPDGAAVLTRKPRLFYVLSGIPSRVFPFDDDPAVLLADADRLGARYVLLDRWDGLAGSYVGGALQRYPQAFCSVRNFGTPDAPTYLLGVLPPSERGVGAGAGTGEVRIAGCTTDFALGDALGVGYSPSRSMRIPLLDGLDP